VSVTTPATPALSFERLVIANGQARSDLSAQVSRAVNASLTVRNWLIGFHIAEYEQQGTKRARYGDTLAVWRTVGRVAERKSEISDDLRGESE